MTLGTSSVPPASSSSTLTFGIFSQPARYHRTGGARTTDDEVVMWLYFGRKFRLIHVYPLGEICCLGTWFRARWNICIDFHKRV